MKLFVLTISFLFVTACSHGQIKRDTTVGIGYIESLRREIAELKQRNNSLFWGYQEKANVSKVDTEFIRSDSSIITFSFKDGQILKRQFNILDKHNNVVQYTIHFYDGKQQVKYIEDWQNLKDDYFDSKLSSSERLEYDSLGRPTLSVKYIQLVHRTVRKKLYYDQSGTIQIKTDIIKSYALWDE